MTFEINVNSFPLDLPVINLTLENLNRESCFLPGSYEEEQSFVVIGQGINGISLVGRNENCVLKNYQSRLTEPLFLTIILKIIYQPQLESFLI
jgi:hypothetical protein